MTRSRGPTPVASALALGLLALFSGVFEAGQSVVDQDGTVITVDVVNDDGDPSVQGIRVVDQPPGGDPTSETIPSSFDPVLDQAPSIALNPLGGVVVVWSRRQGTDFELAMSSRANGGSWSPHALLTYNSTSDEVPAVLVDPTGVAHIVWWGNGLGGPVYLQSFSVASRQAVGPRYAPLEAPRTRSSYNEAGGLEEPGIPTISAPRKASEEPCPSNPAARPEHGVVRSCGRPAAYQLSGCILVVGVQDEETNAWDQVIADLSSADLSATSIHEIVQSLADSRCPW